MISSTKSESRLFRVSRGERVLFLRQVWKLARLLSIDSQPIVLVFGKIGLIVDCFHRALGLTGATVDALVWIDIDLLIVGVKAVDRAHRNTVGKSTFPAIISYNEGHNGCLSRFSLRSISDFQLPVTPFKLLKILIPFTN
jgi:hypothetical protein